MTNILNVFLAPQANKEDFPVDPVLNGTEQARSRGFQKRRTNLNIEEMAQAKWVIDQEYSEIGFKAKHISFCNVSGKLSRFNALIASRVDLFSNAIIEFDGNIDRFSIYNAGQGKPCKGNVFAGGRFPEVTLEAVSFSRIDEVNYKLTGNLSLYGITNSITLDTEFSGLLRDPWGSIKAGFAMTGILDTRQWDVKLCKSADMPASAEVRLNIGLQFIRK